LVPIESGPLNGAGGKLLYALLPPEGLSFDSLIFHSSGFSRTARGGDFPVYEDYLITNLPEIFGR
jgi:hypothetical protein